LHDHKRTAVPAGLGHRQEGPAAPHPVPARLAQRNRPVPALRSGIGARPARLLRQAAASDFFANPAASDPKYIVKLGVEGGFNGIVLQIGLAEKFYWDYAGEVPLILKLNGKTDLPPDDEALSPLNASVAMPCDWVPTRSATPSMSAARPGDRLHAATYGAQRCQAAGYAPCRLVVPAGLGRGCQGRQGFLLCRR
jgi:hypothetical protein